MVFLVGGSVPRHARLCRRARGRQGRFAPLKRWPEGGPSWTAAARVGISRVQVGTEGWSRSNKRMAPGAPATEVAFVEQQQSVQLKELTS